MADPVWLAKARSYVGLKEIPGKHHSPTILGWWKALKSYIRDDETPWCGGFVGGALQRSGTVKWRFPKNPEGARNWLDYGITLDQPAYGCIVVFWRGKKSGWSGHVGFLVGKDQKGNLMVLGGNQGNRVSIMAFSPKRVLGYRWPGTAPSQDRYTLPLLKSDGTLSENEA